MQAPLYTTLPQALAYRARHCPDRAAFIFRDKTGRRRHVITFGQWHRLAGRYAAVLRKKGVGKGSMVLNTLPNSPERVVCEMGVLYTGAATVNSQCLLTDGSDVMRGLRQSRCSVVLLDPDAPNSPWALLQRHARVSNDGQATSDELPGLQWIELIRRRRDENPETEKEKREDEDGDFLTQLQNDLDKGDDWCMADDITANDLCTVFTTSGSTGFSKLVKHSHNNIVCLLEATTRAANLTDNGDPVAFYHNSPLGWYGGYPSTFLLMCRTRVLCDQKDGTPEDLPAFIAMCIREENCSAASIVPTEISVLLHRWKKEKKKPLTAEENGIASHEEEADSDEKEPGSGKEDKREENQDKNDVLHTAHDGEEGKGTRSEAKTKPTHGEQNTACMKPTNAEVTERDERSVLWERGQLSSLAVTGQPVTKAVVEQALSLASSVLVLYASTEMGPVAQAVITPATVDQYQDYFVGSLIPGIQVRIVSEDDEDTPLPDGQAGHLLIKHPFGFTGYLNDPETTASAFTHDGFFRTRDRAQLSTTDKGKALTVYGRMGDAITRGPVIYYPEWIETRLCACPGVLSAIVVGVPHDETESGSCKLCACVVLEDDVSVQKVREHMEKELVAPSVSRLTARPDHYLQFTEFPLLYTNRPNRRLVKEMAEQRVKGNNRV